MPDKGTRPQTYGAWLQYGIVRLREASIADAETDARLLLAFATNTDHSYAYLHRNDPMDPADIELYEYYLERRAEHEPLQYLTREACFFGEWFRVDPHVLIPRQDTEILVEEALHHLCPGMQVLDLCTGSGCILLSLIKHGSVCGIGADCSAAALAVAEQNRRRLHLSATWIESDLFLRVGGRFDEIVCNPPYIATAELEELAPEVRDFEPRIALDGGMDGLDFYRRIIQEAPRYLRPGGRLLLEIGCTQAEAVCGLLQRQGFLDIRVIQDLEKRDRVVTGKTNGF